MWAKSKPGDYISFRTFIFGITSQSMFPHGVIYEGVSEEPMSFRGESGANDSMVSPTSQQKLSTHTHTKETDSAMRQFPPDHHARHAIDHYPQRLPLLPPW